MIISTGLVKVIHGANDGTFDCSGARVGHVRRNLWDAFNLRFGALPFVNGEQVDDGFQLRSHDILEFIFPWGRKGSDLRPPFKWYGAKWRFMPRLIPLFPDHKLYVSVFGGSGADILRKEPSDAEVYNDLNGNLSNFFGVLQNEAQLEQLQRRLARTPYSREQFEDCLEIIQPGRGDSVERAWAFVTAANQIRNGLDPGIALPSWWSNSVDQRRLKWLLLPEHLQIVADRIRLAVVENKPWQDILRAKGQGGYDSSDTFFFLDPPYVSETRDAASRRRYDLEMTEADHERLLKSLQIIKGKAMICGYSSPLYEQYLAGWRREEFSVTCATSHATTRPTRTEVVWMNY